MWRSVANIILSYRKSLLGLVLSLTLLMAWQGSGVKVSYDLPRLLPNDNPVFLEFLEFKKTFGEDANVLIIGTVAPDLFEKNFLADWYNLGKRLEEERGVQGVISVAHAYNLVKDTTEKKFQVKPLLDGPPSTQLAADQMKELYLSLPFYEGRLYNEDSKATIMALTLDKDLLGSFEKVELANRIKGIANEFGSQHGVEMKYSGIAYLRAFRTEKTARELIGFLLLSVCISALILWMIFRSATGVLFPIFVVGCGVLWTQGLIYTLGYEVTILSGLMPTLIVVIGIPNCIYLTNQYHIEMQRHGDKLKALKLTIEKIGYVTFFANLTTAIGFGVFSLMDIEILKEFGIVAFLSISSLFVISLIMIPVIYSYLPPPQSKHTNHLNSPLFTRLLNWIESWVFRGKRWIQLATLAVVLISLFGLTKLRGLGYIFDDIPHQSSLYQDLKFFESNFNGVVPLEVVVDTGKEKGTNSSSTWKRLNKLHKVLTIDTLGGRPISLVDGLKYATQAYYNGKSNQYNLPGSMEKSFIYKYFNNSGGDGDADMMQAYVDSTGRYARVSVQIRDIGSEKLPAILDSLQAKADKIFPPEKYKVTFTGTAVMASTGFSYLVKELIWSVIFAFGIIGVIIAFLFRSPKMLIAAFIPNLIPLLLIAAFMGFGSIYLKPSTVLVFSVAFGIAIDFTIHFLAKYRQELEHSKLPIGNRQARLDALGVTIREKGLGMLYTTVILFFGFVIFMFSSFEGTKYLGMLTSMTIIVALFSNLVVLPTVLQDISLGRRVKKD